jgi:hypothetical protein
VSKEFSRRTRLRRRKRGAPRVGESKAETIGGQGPLMPEKEEKFHERENADQSKDFLHAAGVA